jgi:transcription initiation factor TFIIIB Brf1 subunit/transcription initiation factor TFIIB
MGKEEDHLQSITECPDCASENIVHSTMRDQVICKDCGLVFEPFTPVEMPASAAPAKAKPAKAKKAKPAKNAKAKKAKPAKKARAKAKPAKKAKKSKSKKKFGWW